MDESRIVVDSANLLPPAGCEVTFLEGGTGTKFTAVFFPHPTLWLTSSLTFQVAVPMSYPESPPLVSCDNPTDLGSALKSVEKYIHADGNVVLPILASEGNTTQGWHSHYTLSDVLHAIALLFRDASKPYLLPVESVSLASPKLLRHTGNESPAGGGVKIEGGEASLQGKRFSMEDYSTCMPSFSLEDSSEYSDILDAKGPSRSGSYSLFAVFDGHGGTDAANHANTQLPKLLRSHLLQGASEEEALWKVFRALDEGFLSSRRTDSSGPGGMLSGDPSGATALVALIRRDDGFCWVANAGDSRAVLARRGRPIPMSRDHKPLAPSEVARITHAGGFVFRNRVMGRLGVARAIGDAALKTGRKGLPLVTAEPEIVKIRLSRDDEALILACDGLWDVVRNEEAVDHVRWGLQQHKPLSAVAKSLAEDAINRGSMDNVSVVIIKIGDDPVASAPISTPRPVFPDPTTSPSGATGHSRSASTGATTGGGGGGGRFMIAGALAASDEQKRSPSNTLAMSGNIQLNAVKPSTKSTNPFSRDQQSAWKPTYQGSKPGSFTQSSSGSARSRTPDHLSHSVDSGLANLAYKQSSTSASGGDGADPKEIPFERRKVLSGSGLLSMLSDLDLDSPQSEVSPIVFSGRTPSSATPTRTSDVAAAAASSGATHSARSGGGGSSRPPVARRGVRSVEEENAELFEFLMDDNNFDGPGSARK